MRTRTIAALVILAAVATGAAEGMSSRYFTFDNLNSFFSALVAEENIGIKRGVMYGDNARHRLDVYRPRGGKGRAVILFLYGGGWTGGKRSTYGFAGAALASQGFTVVIPDYRLYPEARFPDFVEDAARAYVWAVRNEGKGKPVFVMGHSAGAHMAALIALDDRYISEWGNDLPRPAGLIGLAGPYAFDPTTWPTTREIFATAKTADEARPAAHVDGKAPPALLFHGLKDETVRLWNMQTLAKAYEAAGRKVEAREVPGTSHIGILLAMARPFRWRHDVLERVVRFVGVSSGESTGQ